MRKPHHLTRGWVLGLSISALLLKVAVGCSSSDTVSAPPFDDSTGGSTKSGGEGGGNSGASATTGMLNPSTGSQSTGSHSTSSGNDPDAACAATTAEATVVPVNMYLMFDDSGSMASNNKWDDATAALKAFFTDPATAGLRVALRFFPDGDCASGACAIDACAVPEVPLGELTAAQGTLDNQETFLTDTVNGKSPGGSGGTPLSAALAGAEQFASDYQAAHPAEKAVVVLVTDGAPNGCEEDHDAITAYASDAYATSGILTYSVGLQGSSEDLMNKIAVAGNTTQAFFIGTGTDASTQLVNALKTIATSAVSCQLVMPQHDSMGNDVDPAKVNVQYTPGDGSGVEDLGKVKNAAACGTSTTGWYYDDNAAPTLINLCPDACTSVQADSGAKLSLLAGCASNPDMPH